MAIKAYKVFNPDWTCRDFQYEVGKTYETSDGKAKICGHGFHACERLVDCFNYYDFDPKNRVAEVELDGEIDELDDKICSSKITIVREMSWMDVLRLVNTGDDNYGKRNTGDRNTGDGNTGDRNTGDHNTGNGNTGDHNTGHRNTGHDNTGDRNTGDDNYGDRNTGYHNTGHCNTGHCNTGNLNTGSWNACDRETGYFNTTTPLTINVFDRPCSVDVWERADKPRFIYFVLDADLGYKGSFKKSWDETTDEDRRKIKGLPNFSWEVFTEISGIEKPEDWD